MGCIAAYDSSQANQCIVSAAPSHSIGYQRNLERAGHMNYRDVIVGNAVAFAGV